MKSPTLLAVSALLLTAACAPPGDPDPRLAELRDEQNRADHVYCIDYGTTPGSRAYDTCRSNRASLHMNDYYSYNTYDPYYDPHGYNYYSPASGHYMPGHYYR